MNKSKKCYYCNSDPQLGNKYYQLKEKHNRILSNINTMIAYRENCIKENKGFSLREKNTVKAGIEMLKDIIKIVEEQ